MNREQLAGLIDHTLLRPDATAAEIERLCDEALHWGCASVCVNSSRIAEVVERLAGSAVVGCAVVGFPLGAAATAAKAAEAEYCVRHGAREIDVVLNLGWFSDRAFSRVTGDIATVKQACGGDVALKVIIESALLEPADIELASSLVVDAGADFVKTSTGFHGAGGATVDAVRIMRRTVGPAFGVKASGGIRDLAAVTALLDAGASRLGLSATVRILTQLGG